MWVQSHSVVEHGENIQLLSIESASDPLHDQLRLTGEDPARHFLLGGDGSLERFRVTLDSRYCAPAHSSHAEANDGGSNASFARCVQCILDELPHDGGRTQMPNAAIPAGVKPLLVPKPKRRSGEIGMVVRLCVLA